MSDHREEVVFEGWPQYVGNLTVEPLSGAVRFSRRGIAPIELPAGDVRVLAAGAKSWRKEMLSAAATEAERQHAVLTGLMEG